MRAERAGAAAAVLCVCCKRVSLCTKQEHLARADAKCPSYKALTRALHQRAGLHTGRRQPIAVRPQAMLEAKDLPRCDLSDYIEHRLQLALGRDRADRARLARVGVEQARPMQLLLVEVEIVVRVQPHMRGLRMPGAHGRRAGACRATVASGSRFRILGALVQTSCVPGARGCQAGAARATTIPGSQCLREDRVTESNRQELIMWGLHAAARLALEGLMQHMLSALLCACCRTGNMHILNTPCALQSLTNMAAPQVPEVTGLTLRVINNVNKRMEVKPKFYDAFKGEGFPSEFSYTQKVPSPLAPPVHVGAFCWAVALPPHA